MIERRKINKETKKRRGKIRKYDKKKIRNIE